jgi:hypothetical protein
VPVLPIDPRKCGVKVHLPRELGFWTALPRASCNITVAARQGSPARGTTSWFGTWALWIRDVGTTAIRTWPAVERSLRVE